MSTRKIVRRLVAVGPLVAVATIVAPLGAPEGSALPASADWLATLNHYRAMSGVGPVIEVPEWSFGAVAHARYMVRTGSLTHDEDPANPWWSTEGAEAAKHGNVGVNSSATTTAREHLEAQLAAPFHAVSLLSPQLTRSGFGMFADAGASPWRSAMVVDVWRGVDPTAPVPNTPILFPGNGATTALDRLAAETPDPRSYCGWSGTAGLPVLAMFPVDPGPAEATITGPNGPVEVCTLTAETTDGTARATLAGAKAVIVLPAARLPAGSFRVELTTADAGSVGWNFTVDPTPPPTHPETSATGPASTFIPITPVRLVDTRRSLGAARLPANQLIRIEIAGRRGVPADATAISANLTVVGPAAAGYLTVSACSASVPEVSSINFRAGRTLANAAVLPLDVAGDLCVVSTAATHLLIDVNGAFDASGADRFVAIRPARIADTRIGFGGSTRLRAGGTLRLPVRGTAGVPASATAAVLTITAVDPAAGSSAYVTVTPCGTSPNASNLNLRRGETRPNLVVVPIAADGTICATSTVATDLLADVAGYFAPTGRGGAFTPLLPLRMVDTRQRDTVIGGGTSGARLSAGESIRVAFAGERGIPASAKAVALNLTATGSLATGYVTAYPCGTRPDVSNLNFTAGVDVANAAVVPLDSTGAACFYAERSTWLIIDVTGSWS